MKQGIGYSPLSDKVYIGKQNEKTRTWSGTKRDITSEFLSVAYAFFEENTIRDISCSNGDSNLFINIKKDTKSIERVIKKLQKLMSE